MDPGRRECEIVDDAINAFHRATGFKIEKGITQLPVGAHRIDTTLRLKTDDRTVEYWVEIKTTLTDTVVGRIAHQIEDNQAKWLIITRHVPQQLAKKLHDLNIQFIDTVGNAYINDPPTFIFIHGNKPQRPFLPTAGEGLLGRAGIHVVFALLCKHELLNATYREIATHAQVALGTVAGVMKDLAAQGYLIDINDDQRRFIRKKALLDKWITAYVEKLRHKKLLGRYKATKADFWLQAEITHLDAQWGGEVAAHRLTRYIKPEMITIYTRKPINNLILDLKLRQDKNGDVEIRERFWKFENPDFDKTIVPPLLVYADLLATGDTRNIETAKKLYDDYLQRYIDKD
jgi:hypothetical protein